MRTDYGTLAAIAERLEHQVDAKRRELALARHSGDARAVLAAKADLRRAEAKHRQALRVAIGGIKRIARRGPDRAPTTHPQPTR